MRGQADVERFVELRAKGTSLAVIATTLHVSKSTLVSWNRKMATEITFRRHGELEALMEKYQLRREHQLRMFGEELRRITAELGKRDYSEVPTEKLVDLSIKLAGAVQKSEPNDPYAVRVKHLVDRSLPFSGY